jgi:hypothetical protein
MTQQREQAVIDALIDENADMQDEIDRLKAENARLGGVGGNAAAIQHRTCVNCHKRMPDGPAYFPGYFEQPSTDLATEAYRHHCVYCRQGQ